MEREKEEKTASLVQICSKLCGGSSGNNNNNKNVIQRHFENFNQNFVKAIKANQFKQQHTFGLIFIIKLILLAEIQIRILQT